MKKVGQRLPLVSIYLSLCQILFPYFLCLCFFLGRFLVQSVPALVFFDTGASRSFFMSYFSRGLHVALGAFDCPP